MTVFSAPTNQEVEDVKKNEDQENVVGTSCSTKKRERPVFKYEEKESNAVRYLYLYVYT